MKPQDEREQRQRIRERFTRSADSFTKFALSKRTGDADRLVALAAPRGDEIALDLACGPGTFARAFARHVRFLHGLDLTPALLAQAQRAIREAGLGNVALACGDAYALPYRSGSLDLATCGYSLHHMTEPARAFAELARVLRPRACLAIVDIIVPAEADAERHDEIERARDNSHAHTLKAAGLEALLESAGFRVRAAETVERARTFPDWMRIAGWEPGDPAWAETYRLMEASMPADAAGYHPRYASRDAEAPTPVAAEIEFVQTSRFVVAVKE
jgi:ubiquinone/menaquinone biosynthesis C-methylase UbiE